MKNYQIAIKRSVKLKYRDEYSSEEVTVLRTFMAPLGIVMTVRDIVSYALSAVKAGESGIYEYECVVQEQEVETFGMAFLEPSGDPYYDRLVEGLEPTDGLE